MGAFHRGPRLGTKPLTTALAPDSPAPEGQQKAPSRLALPRLRRCAWSAECERSSASCENCVWCVPPVTSCTCTRRERIASVGAATQAKGARGIGLRTAPPAFSRRVPFPPAQHRHRHLPLRHKKTILEIKREQNCVCTSGWRSHRLR